MPLTLGKELFCGSSWVLRAQPRAHNTRLGPQKPNGKNIFKSRDLTKV